MENLYEPQTNITKNTPIKSNNKMMTTTGYVTGNWKIDLAQMSLSVCPKTKSMLGISNCCSFELKSFFRLLEGQMLISFKAWMRRACATDSNLLDTVTFDLCLENGIKKSFKITGFHYSGNWGVPSMVLGVLEDITQKVQEDRIALSVINHEMRTPLSVMKLNAQMIQMSSKKHYKVSPSEMACNIERHVDSLTNILNQYLSNSGDTLNTVKMNPTVFDLNRLVDQILNDMTGIYPEHRFLKLSNLEVSINADRYLILQVLINYLTNAVKYSPPQSTISVSLQIERDQVVVAVADQGNGIFESDLLDVFERFYKKNPKETTNDTSKGLGLYMVKQLIEKHKGRAFVENGVNGGSIFYFTLPRKQF